MQVRRSIPRGTILKFFNYSLHLASAIHILKYNYAQRTQTFVVCAQFICTLCGCLNLNLNQNEKNKKIYCKNVVGYMVQSSGIVFVFLIKKVLIICNKSIKKWSQCAKRNEPKQKYQIYFQQNLHWSNRSELFIKQS